MFIPLNEPDWFKYVMQCRKLGIKLVSRYQGVSIHWNGGKPSFYAKYQNKHIGLFPMTKEGELAAYIAYREYRN